MGRALLQHILSILDNIIVRLVPARDGSQLWAWKASEGMENKAVEDEGAEVDGNDSNNALPVGGKQATQAVGGIHDGSCDTD